jgi:hypothetical protein
MFFLQLEIHLRLVDKIQGENQIITDRLLEEIKKLHDQHPHTIEDLLPRIYAMVEERLEEFLIPFLKNLRDQCIKNDKGVETEVYRAVNKIVEKTSEIREAVRSKMSRTEQGAEV